MERSVHHSRSVKALPAHFLPTLHPQTVERTRGLRLPGALQALPPARSCWLPFGLKLSAVRHYKLTHPPQESNHPFFYFNPHLLERFLHLSLRLPICFLPCYSIMKFSRILVLYLAAMAAPSVLAVPLRHVDRCSLDSTDVRCIGQKDDHNRAPNPHWSGDNVSCE